MRARRAAWLARAKRELKIGKLYQVQTARLRKTSGMDQAKARAAAAKKSLSDLVTPIMEQPGTTMEGMLIKAQAVTTFNKSIASKFYLHGERWAEQLAASVLQLASTGDASA
jgi:16S rRNA G527 N7-methylase RsmG